LDSTSLILTAMTVSAFVALRMYTLKRKRLWYLPRKIIFVRHGESLGNVEETAYQDIPDWKIPLTERGIAQAKSAGDIIRQVTVGEKIVMYYSPYQRTTTTMEHVAEAIPFGDLLIIQEEPRIREQDFGNFQANNMVKFKLDRSRFGRFFYRFPNGESGADVYDRVSSFLESMYRTMMRIRLPHKQEYSIVIVSHGLTIRLFLMRWFRWTVEDFDKMSNPKNSVPIILERDDEGHYRLHPDSWKSLGVTEETSPQVKWPLCMNRNGPGLNRHRSETATYSLQG